MPALISPEEVERRFFDSIEPEPMSGCWLWTGKLNPAGYGERHKVGLAHRYAWTKLRGPIPVGMWLDHKCRLRCCVNPDHLRVVTPRENSVTNSLGVGAKNAAKTHCHKGHAYDMFKATGDGRSRRECSACIKIRTKARAAREKQRRSTDRSVREAEEASLGDGVVYAVRHADGRWLMRMAFSGHGLAWTDATNKSVFYRSQSQAQARITMFLKAHPNEQRPSVVAFMLTQMAAK